MDCKEAKRLMPDLLTGEGTLREKVALKLHLLSCRDCRREWEGLREVLRGLKALTPVGPVAFEASPPQVIGRKKGARWGWGRFLPATALAGILLALFFAWPREVEPPPPELSTWEGVEEVLFGLNEGGWEELLVLYLPEDMQGLEEALLGLLQEEWPYEAMEIWQEISRGDDPCLDQRSKKEVLG